MELARVAGVGAVAHWYGACGSRSRRAQIPSGFCLGRSGTFVAKPIAELTTRDDNETILFS